MAQSNKGLRYVVVALLVIILLAVISTTSGITQNTYHSAANVIKESSRWTSSRLGSSGLKAEPAQDSEQSSGGFGLDEDGATTGAPASGAQEGSSSQHNTTPNPFNGNVQFRGKPSDVPRMNATFVTLARNSDVWEISRSIRQVEDRFNWQFGYDWVFLNDKPFNDEFKKITTALTSGRAKYGLIPKEHWSYPEWIDQNKAKEVREDMARRKIIYGDSESYRHMCRYESGFFFRHPLMLEYEWYWRVEPSIELFCDIQYDAFRYMAEHGKKYSFVLSLYEYVETIPTLWDSTKKYIQQHPEHIAKGNSMQFISDNGGSTYNKCHFWSNFEIGNLNWLRSPAYIDYFTSLDKDGGFFYERWGDAPVHSIAAALMLPKEEIHFFEDIAYYHIPFTHCPDDEDERVQKKCHCNPNDNFDWNGYSCTKKFLQMHGIPLSAKAIAGTKMKRS